MTTILIEPMNGENKCVQRILVIRNGSLLDAEIESLLRPNHKVNLIIFTIAPDKEVRLFEAIGRYQPDVVVVIDEALHVTNSINLLMFLQSCLRLRVVGVNSKNNRALIYDKSQFLIVQAADLVAVVKDSATNNFSNQGSDSVGNGRFPAKNMGD